MVPSVPAGLVVLVLSAGMLRTRVLRCRHVELTIGPGELTPG